MRFQKQRPHHSKQWSVLRTTHLFIHATPQTKPARRYKTVSALNREVQSDKVHTDVRSGKQVTFSYSHTANINGSGGGGGGANEIVFVVKLMFFIYYYLQKWLLTHRCISYVKAPRRMNVNELGHWKRVDRASMESSGTEHVDVVSSFRTEQNWSPGNGVHSDHNISGLIGSYSADCLR
jgi:hypothetical protein